MCHLVAGRGLDRIPLGNSAAERVSLQEQKARERKEHDPQAQGADAVAWPVGSEERNFDALDFYECLRAFRRVIEPDGFRVLCQAARPNVQPSGMSSQAGAWTSYVLTLGQSALTKDLFGTFDPVEDIASVGTVEEQDEFIMRHWAELKKRL
jgi:hypothetical protein